MKLFAIRALHRAGRMMLGYGRERKQQMEPQVCIDME